MRLLIISPLILLTALSGNAALAIGEKAEAGQAEKKLVPVNLARGKQVTASSEETGKGNFARHAVDGDTSTRWCAAGQEAPQWLTIDLGQPEHLTRCDLKWESSSGIYHYRLEGSVDGKNWLLLADKPANQQPEYHDRFDTKARYLRVTFLGSTSGGWASLREVSLFGDKMIEIDARLVAAEREKRYLAEVKPPEGFDVTLVAAPPLVNYPVYVAAALDGTLYVSSDKNGSLGREPNRGSIVRLRDLDGDGRADESMHFVPNVDSPRGLVWDHDRLYLMHPPHLSAFIDHDADGVADEERVLVKNIAFGFKDRPADHTSNGVTLGIDGWLYLAIGDFGFLEAEGADGRKLQLRGGGVVRVRPDGSGLELYSRGTRNILEVALDPLLNGFARDNTNDGGGWDIRLHHFTGLEEHGYPSLFKNFSDEIIAPLADYGGGSGVGALYLDEPGFPAGSGRALYTADWGRELAFRHALKPKGATFEADQNEFLRLPRVTDLDVDGLSRLYATSWKGAVFNYAGEDVGYVVRLSPQGYKAEPLPDFERASAEELVLLLRSPSHRRRLEAQRTLLRRRLNSVAEVWLKALATDAGESLESRVAAIFTLKQGLGVASHDFLAALADNAELRPFAIRALADRWDELDAIPIDVLIAGLSDDAPRTRLESAVGLGRLGSQRLNGTRAADALAQRLDDDDPIIAHTVRRVLIRLNAADTCFDVIDDRGSNDERRTAALHVLSGLHTEAVAQGLVTRVNNEVDAGRRKGLLAALCRLHFCEGEWKGNSWGTRPDTTGPYYQPEQWDGAPAVEAALKAALASASADEAAYLLAELSRHKIHFSENLDRLLAMAAADKSMVPVAVNELAQSNHLPAEGAAIALRALGSHDFDPAVRVRAARCLLRGEDAAAFKTVLNTLPELQAQAKRSAEIGRLTDALSNAVLLSRYAELLAEEAARCDGRVSLWADALLIFLSVHKEGSPEARDLARHELEKGWGDARRRAQILSAVLLRNYREYEPQVRLALADPDADVADLARRIAKKWKLSDKALPAGPPIKALKPDDVLATVLSGRGDVAVGEQLFVKLNCSKCHTIRADEPPRGPYLVNVAKTYKRGQLAEAVLLPNKSIAQGFATNIFLLEDGRTVIGFVTSEAADRVTVRDAEGREHEISLDAIEEREKQELSVMPEGLVNEVSVEEFASLVSFLESLSGR